MVTHANIRKQIDIKKISGRIECELDSDNEALSVSGSVLFRQWVDFTGHILAEMEADRFSNEKEEVDGADLS